MEGAGVLSISLAKVPDPAGMAVMSITSAVRAARYLLRMLIPP